MQWMWPQGLYTVNGSAWLPRAECSFLKYNAPATYCHGCVCLYPGTPFGTKVIEVACRIFIFFPPSSFRRSAQSAAISFAGQLGLMSTLFARRSEYVSAALGALLHFRTVFSLSRSRVAAHDSVFSPLPCEVNRWLLDWTDSAGVKPTDLPFCVIDLSRLPPFLLSC